ncbi:DNA alkylation repair protein [Gordonia humi]|uniref:DNA alkylation repair protein n=1 Tax=Gordonia humi TaxID=686429 RepID=UPI00161E5404
MGPDSSAAEIVDALVALGDPDRAAGSRRFFKTAPGEYGEGDEFVGIRVPVLRALAKRLRGLSAPTIVEVLESPIHEARQLALFVLTANIGARDSDRAAWVQVYRDAVRAGRVNNWDLVDCSADPVLGAWLLAADDYAELIEWASSEDLWERRVGIIGTFAFIRAGRADAVLAVAPIVVADRRDLIQKAFGWMLREVGKRIDRALLIDYLDAHAAEMGRTALSYAVEHLPAEERARYRAM